MKKHKIYNALCYSLIMVIFSVMCFYISKKEGFHEDEIFSYGSSNYRYDNIFQPYGNKDYINKCIDELILNNKNVINNILYYIKEPNEFINELNEIQSKEKPIWKTKEEAIEYVSIQKEDILNFFIVYYNQVRDAHPPLFYFLVHIVSILFINNFSKYIIFFINIILFLLSIIIIKKILELLNKETLFMPIIILWGLSIGGISTVIFQRMYMMLTFFIIYYTYINIYIVKNDFHMDKNTKTKLTLTIILGFLTQYYFCIYILFFFITMQILMLKKNKKKECKTLLICHIKSAIIGIIVFPAAIYHIFFSYRGVTNITNQYRIIDFFKIICESYNLNIIIGIIIFISITTFSILVLKKNKDCIPCILLITIIGYVLVIAKISPYLDLRYVMGILPIISITIIFAIDYYFKNNFKVICITSGILFIISIINLYYIDPYYLYKGYNENVEIARKYSDFKYIYIEDNSFNHIQSIPEFMIYNKSIILNANKDELKYLYNNEELKQEKEFIVSIKRYMNVEEILKQVLKLTERENYTLLLDGSNETGNVIYRIY